jgi:DNA-3-methyladenine glycosylase II
MSVQSAGASAGRRAVASDAELPTPPAPLDEALLGFAALTLAERDDALAGIVARHGMPPLWARPAGFETLVAIILEQQVSLRSGAAALGRLRLAARQPAAGGGATAAAIEPLEPATILALGEAGARAAGLTRQKARYVVALAAATLDGTFAPDVVARSSDDEARALLVKLLGVGRWSADIYLLMALGRPDVWPDGDLALAVAMRHAKGLAAVPDATAQRAIAAGWAPWRAVAARILWHAYLAGER